MNIKLAAFELVAMGNFNFMSAVVQVRARVAFRRRVTNGENIVRCFSVHLPVFFYFTIGYVMNIKLAAFQLVG